MKLSLFKSSQAVDCETTGLYPFIGDRPYCFSVCDIDENEFLAHTAVNPLDRSVDWKPAQLERVVDILQDARVRKVMFNAPFDRRMAHMLGIDTRGRIDDVMIKWKVLYSASQAKLKPLAFRLLGIPMDDEKELQTATVAARREAKKKGWKIADDKLRYGDKPVAADYWLAPFEIWSRYAKLDAKRTIFLDAFLDEELDEDPRLRRAYEEELELMHVTYDMISRGVRCDRRVCSFEQSRNRLQARMHYAAVVKGLGREINLNSPIQVGNYVYKELGFPVTKYTDNGNPSTDAEALKEMDHPVVREITKVKAAEVANKNFFDVYLMHSRYEGGVSILHPEFNQLGARTTRYACRKPNLQNVANALNTRSFEPIQARTPYGPRPGYCWWHWDWSQIEMWIFAAEAEDENLLYDLAHGHLHTNTANRVFGKGRDIVAEELANGGRSNAKARAKMLNFGVVFGMGIQATMDFLKCDRAEARENLDLYYEGYRRIRPFMNELSDKARNDGFIWNRYGRRLEVPKDAAYRAVNYLVQSEAAQHMKRKMRWLHKLLVSRPELDAHLVLTIHDELVVEAPDTPAWRALLPSISKHLEDHEGIWSNLKNLPLEVAVTKTSWDKKEKLEV